MLLCCSAALLLCCSAALAIMNFCIMIVNPIFTQIYPISFYTLPQNVIYRNEKLIYVEYFVHAKNPHPVKTIMLS